MAQDKLLSKLEESEPEPPTSQEDECVICINARATMQTSPCGHRVVCRRCFVKTIQSAVAQRLLPLRCVICRARINRLTSGTDSWRLQESASSYSMGSKSWSVPGSASSYSVSSRVAQSASLYSMSSGSSLGSGMSNSSTSSGSNTSIRSSASSISGQKSPGAHSNGPHSTCPIGCSGAHPRQSSQYQYTSRRNSRFYKGRVQDLQQNRLPPIKEFRSPVRVPATAPAQFGNPKYKYASYTQSKNSSSNEISVQIEKNTEQKVCTPNKGISPRVAATKLNLTTKVAPIKSDSANDMMLKESRKKCDLNFSLTSGIKTPTLFRTTSNKCIDENRDNRNNENAERRKKEEKLRLKAEKEAKKEEKRLAKEEEKMAKLLAKEEKKRKGKIDDFQEREALLGNNNLIKD